MDKESKFSIIGKILNTEVKTGYFIFIFLLVVVLSFFNLVYFGVNIKGHDFSLFNSEKNKKGLVNFVYGPKDSMSDKNFFNEVKNSFIEQKDTFVEVNLSQMVARVYKQGEMAFEVKVVTKGKPGSWWETPVGVYKIETKEKTHYSSIGHVTQPWSMQFQGNFFIHGIPYYKDGTPVSNSFSGGCIRLANEDAKKIFDNVSVGTPVLVYEDDFSTDNFSYLDLKPEIFGNNYMASDLKNNFVFLRQNENETINAGQITKLMTALVATEYINIEKTIKIKKEFLVDTKVHRLKEGMSIDIYQLLFLLLRESSNEAALAISSSYGESWFINRMNEKAKSIGMKSTVFVDTTGVSGNNKTTVEDVFMLSKYIYNNRSFIFNITSGKVKTNTYGESIFSDLSSTNSLSERPDFFGGIADESGMNLTIVESKFGDNKRPIFLFTNNSLNSSSDIEKMISYISKKYSY